MGSWKATWRSSIQSSFVSLRPDTTIAITSSSELDVRIEVCWKYTRLGFLPHCRCRMNDSHLGRRNQWNATHNSPRTTGDEHLIIHNSGECDISRRRRRKSAQEMCVTTHKEMGTNFCYDNFWHTFPWRRCPRKWLSISLAILVIVPHPAATFSIIQVWD